MSFFKPVVTACGLLLLRFTLQLSFISKQGSVTGVVATNNTLNGEGVREMNTDPAPKPEPVEPETYVPTIGDLVAGCTFDWDSENVSMDFTDSAAKPCPSDGIAQVSGDGFGANVLKIDGKGNFTLPLLAGKYLVPGYTYTFSFNYATISGGKVDMTAVTASGDRIAATDVMQDVFGIAHYSVTVENGDTMLAFHADGNVKIYIGDMKVELTTAGPTLDQLYEGYSWNMSRTKIGSSTSTTFGQLPEDVKAAMSAGGYNDDTPVIKTNGGDLADFDRTVFYREGNKYHISITYYAMGGGGYFIAYDSTPGNHSAKNGLFTAGYHTVEFDWIVGDKGEYGIIFFNIPDVYITEMVFTLEAED